MGSDPLLMPWLVFLAELLVVTLGTVRIIFVARGLKTLAPILGFAEVTIWLFAIGQIMRNLDDPGCFLAFAGGFALGNYFGLVLNERLAIGTSAIQIITHKDASALVRRLTRADFGVTSLQGQGATGPVQVIFTIVKRKEVETVTRIVKEFDPCAFYAIDEVETVSQGIFPLRKAQPAKHPARPVARFHFAFREATSRKAEPAEIKLLTEPHEKHLRDYEGDRKGG